MTKREGNGGQGGYSGDSGHSWDDTSDREMALCAGLIRGGFKAARAIAGTGILPAEHFSSETARLGYVVILGLLEENGGTLDKPLLRRSLTQQFADAGMETPHVRADAFMADVWDNATAYTPAPAVLVRHAAAVRDAGLMRAAEMRLAGMLAECRAFRIGEGGDGTATDFITGVQQRVFNLAGSTVARDAVSVADALPEFFQKFRERYDAPSSLIGLPTGFRRLDNYLSGLKPGRLHVVAAGSGRGKSTLAGNIIVSACKQSGCAAQVFSLEMERDELLERALYAESRVSSAAYRNKALLAADWERLERAKSILQHLRIDIHADPNLTSAQICSLLRQARFAGNCDVALVDYTQLVSPEPGAGGGRGGSYDTREREVTQVIRSLKKIAMELHIPVIALSQLNDDGKVRESRNIKNDADVLMIISRDGIADEAQDMGDGETCALTIEKQRGGPEGSVMLSFHADYNRFEEVRLDDQY